MSFYVKTANVLLPKPNIDMTKWAVVACDQFTSEKKYWEKLTSYVGESVSSLNLILPEAYLSSNNDNYIKKINENMELYIKNNIFAEYKDTLIFIKRSTPYSKNRSGIIAAIDLEAYSFKDEDKAYIRATEGTVLSRIPPRVKIRENAPLEFPHIMLLMDDRENTIIASLEQDIENMEKLYDFQLNMDGGHIKGYKINDCQKVIDDFKNLLNKQLLISKYKTAEKLLFAVGDGNHSLATAKTCWDNIKTTLTAQERESHPARYALVEIVNIHDEGLLFEPIHRVVFGVDNDKFIQGLKNISKNYSSDSGKIIHSDGTAESLSLPENAAQAVKVIQDFIDDHILSFGGEVDYIHGEQSLKTVTNDTKGVGIMLPSLKKEDLFTYLINFGSLPRKTFSMGEAVEKRYYIEGRTIKKI